MIEGNDHRWIFPVDEMLGVTRIPRRMLMPPPATVTGDRQAMTSALFELDGARVALLDPELLMARLQRAFA